MPTTSLAEGAVRATPDDAAPEDDPPPTGILGDAPLYDRTFWLAYGANLAFMIAVSLLFRYADFVRLAGGGDGLLGLIVGVGAVGSLAARGFQAALLDRLGPRRVWLASLVLFGGACLLHLAIHSVGSPSVYLARFLMNCATAGAFGASIMFVSLRAPAARTAEAIGSLGSSGFIGMAVGPTLGDWLFRAPELSRALVDRMFLVAALGAAVSLALAAIATAGARRRFVAQASDRGRFALAGLPGWLLLAAVAMGGGLGLCNTFLRPYAREVGVEQLGAFFIVYAVTAFTMRIVTRGWADRVGSRIVIVAGLTILAASMPVYLVIAGPATLVVPGLVQGVAHALLFPAVMAAGSLRFPPARRGSATTLMLAMFDLGALVGQPLAGGVVEGARSLGWPPFPTMFLVMAGLLGAVAAGYFLRGGKDRHGAAPVRPSPRPRP